MSLFAELKRRNVIRVAMAYIVAAWLLLQVADVMIDNLGAPGWVFPALLLLLAIGFILALIFAWAFELTPEGLKRERNVDPAESVSAQTGRRLDAITIAMVIVAIAVVLYDRFVPESPPPPAEQAEQPATPATTSALAVVDSESPGTAETPSASVAVLPFVNMSADPDNDYFSEGISEELLNLLVKEGGLRVPSRTSSFAFKDQNRSIQDIASDLDVDHVLEGSVRKAGNRVRITAQLIEVVSDTHLWSETYDRELEDIFAIQDEIASHIVGELTGILSATVHKDQPTENLEAYNLYLKGRYHWERRGGSIEDAERLLREAVALDPEFSDAYGLLSLVYTQMPNYLDAPLDESVERALNAANRASRLDPHQAEADLARANVAIKQRDVLTSLRLHQGVVERHPHHTLARVWYSVTLTFAGYFEEAEKHLNWVRQRDPISAVNLDWLSRTQTVLGKPDAARNALEAVGLGRSAAALSLMQLEFPHGDPGLLLSLEDALPRYLNRAIGTAVAIHRGELTEGAAMAPMTLDMDENEAMWTRFVFHMMRRDFEPIIRLAPEALAQDETVLFMFWWPDFKPLRNDPRVKAIQRAYAIPDVWRELGFPKSCGPLGDDNWECE